MAKDHYLPAAFLARFSSEKKLPTRTRHVWVLRASQMCAHPERAENIGAINDMYRLRTPGQPYPEMVDDTWQGYEKRLGEALNALIDPFVPSVNAEIWLRVLVPFIAGLFVRGPDFTQRLESSEHYRMLQASQEPTWIMDNVNISRLIAMRRSLTAVIAARWSIGYKAGSGGIITNELGYVNSRYDADPRSLGWTIPLSSEVVLQLTPCPDGRKRKILFYSGDGEWRALIERTHLSRGKHLSLNISIAEFAKDFIVGSNAADIEPHLEPLRGPGPVATLIPQQVNSHRMQIVHENEWDRLVCAIRHSPDDLKGEQFEINYEVVTSDWYVAPLLSVNLPEFKSGLQLRGPSIDLGMTGIQGFTDYAPGPFPWEA